MPRKRIAVVLSQAESAYQKNLLKGLVGQAFRYDFDVCVFTTFIKDGTPDGYRLGESNIFNLINPEKFNGAIIVPDTINFSGVTQKIVSDFKKFQLPVVTIDYQLEDIPCIWGSDSDDIEKLVDHLIDVHGCRIIDFISGREGHPHSINREAGYIRSLEKHGIPIEPERIHYGDFGREKSGEIADAIFGSGRLLPQAIACACDSSAESLAEELITRGYRIPEDFRVTGYDTLISASNAVGDVTTMFRNSGYSGAKAVRYMYHELYGKEPDDSIEYKQSDIITSESCGCGIANKKSIFKRNMSTDNIRENISDFYSVYNFMMEDLIAIDSYKEFFWNIDWYVRYINAPDGMYICTSDIRQTESEDASPNIGYPEQMIQVYTLENGEASVDPENIIDSKLMIPQLYKECDKPSVYYFTPLHFNDRSFGYTVLQYINRATVFNDEYASWMRTLDNGFEALRRRLKLKYLYERQARLETFSVTDSLTGIYNRNAYNSIAFKMFKDACDENKNFLVLMGDMNNLKTINDTYGHLEGDEGIRTVAQAMKNACDESEKCFRIGGDEFVIIGVGDYTQDSIKSKFQKIEASIGEYNLKTEKPYKISISLGYEYASARNFDSLEDALFVADEKMFASKQAFKKQHSN